MEDILKILISAAVLGLGIFIGNWISKITSEEVKKGKKWFFILVIIGLAGGIYGFISGNDFFLFTFFFIAVVASRSLRKSIEKTGEKGGEGKEKQEKEKKVKRDDKKKKTRKSSSKK